MFSDEKLLFSPIPYGFGRLFSRYIFFRESESITGWTATLLTDLENPEGQVLKSDFDMYVLVFF